MFTTLNGRLVKDIEYTPAQNPNGKSRANFTIAVDRPKKKNQSQNQQTADFYDCIAWGNTADVLHNNYVKGDYVVADEVKYEANQYTEKQTGQTRTKHQWIINHVIPVYNLVSRRQIEVLYLQNQQRQQSAGYVSQNGYAQQTPQMMQQPQQPVYNTPVQQQYQNPAMQTPYGQPILNMDDVDLPY